MQFLKSLELQDLLGIDNSIVGKVNELRIVKLLYILNLIDCIMGKIEVADGSQQVRIDGEGIEDGDGLSEKV